MVFPRSQVQVSFIPEPQPEPPVSVPQHLRPGVRSGLPAVLLGALVIALYVISIRFGFIHTDREIITQNPTIRTWSGLPAIWIQPGSTPQYSPVAYTAMLVENRLSRGRASAFHAGSIALHALNTALLWLLLRHLAVPGAFLGAAIFAVHPIQLDTVAWVSHQPMLMCSVVYLLGSRLYLKSFDPIVAPVDDAGEPRPSMPAWMTYALACMLAIAAMLCHPIGVTFPLVAWLLARWPHPRLTAQSYHGFPTRAQAPNQIRRLIPLFAIAVLVIVLAWITHQRVHRSDPPIPLGSSLRATLINLMTYPLRIIAPIDVPSLAGADPYDGWFTDHLMYLPFAAIAAALAALGVVMLRRVRSSIRRLAPAAAVLLVASLAGVTFARLPVFRDDTALWTWALDRNPDSPAALNAIAVVELNDRQSPHKALAHLTRALTINPRDPRTLLNIAAVNMHTSDFGKAMMRYHQVLGDDPNHADARYGLAVALAKSGRPRDALEHMQHALSLRPSDIKFHLELASLYSEQGDYRRAIEHYDEVMRLDPRNALACFEAARLLVNLNEWQRAIALLERARKLDPTDVRIVMFAGGLQFELTRLKTNETGVSREELRQGFGTAEMMFRQAILMQPDLALAYLNLGKSLAARSQHAANLQERFDCLNSAVSCFERAATLDPTDTEAPRLRQAAQRDRDEAEKQVR